MFLIIFPLSIIVIVTVKVQLHTPTFFLATHKVTFVNVFIGPDMFAFTLLQLVIKGA